MICGAFQINYERTVVTGKVLWLTSLQRRRLKVSVLGLLELVICSVVLRNVTCTPAKNRVVSTERLRTEHNNRSHNEYPFHPLYKHQVLHAVHLLSFALFD